MESGEKVEGPWLSLAVICEKVIEDKENRLSLIGLMDRITFAAAGPEAPAQMPPVTISLMVVVGFKSGFARGSYMVGMQPVSPSGKRGPLLSTQLLFEGEDRGANFISQVMANLTEPGLHWFDIMLENRVVTRIPLRIVYQSVSMGPSVPPAMTE